MKIIKLYLILQVIHSLVYASSTVELVTPIATDGMLNIEGKMMRGKEPLQLFGTARAKQIPNSDEKVIQINWEEVHKPGQEQPLFFDKPLPMNFYSPNIKSGTKLEFEEDDEFIDEAFQKLKSKRSKAKLKNPKTKVRNIVGSNAKTKLSSSLSKSNETMKSQFSQMQQGVRRNSSRGSSTTNESGLHSNSSNSHSNKRHNYMENMGSGSSRTIGYDDVVHERNRTPRGYSETVTPSIGNGGSSNDNGVSHELVNLGKRDPKSSSKENDSSNSKDGGSQSSSKNGSTNDGELYDGDGSHQSGRRNKNSSSSTNSGGISGGGSRDFASGYGKFNPKSKDRNSSTSTSKYEDENIRVEITTTGCPVRVDNANNRVIVQNKTIHYKDEVKVKESECGDSLEHYLIKKDYLCENCRDFVDLNSMVVMPTFERFWTDKNGTKKVLSSQPEKDETQKFPIIRDKGKCEPYVDIENMQAFPQIEFIYMDRVNARQVAKMCHKDDTASASPIELTSNGCTPEHNFDKSWSYQKKRGVFTMDDKEHIAFACKIVGEPIKHDIDTGVCNSNINVVDREVTLMGKRYVIIEGIKVYLSDCEPVKSKKRLMETVEGCEEKYVHAQKEGRSYLKKRWYYLDGLNKQFVTTCNKSTQFLPHKIQITGYEHDDGNRKSKQITTVYIEPSKNNRIDLYKNYINPSVEPIPYELVEVKAEATGVSTFQGCYKITQTNNYKYWRRPDKSVLKQFCGIGKPIKSRDLCKRVTEKQNQFHMTTVTGTKRTTAKLKWVQIDLHDEHFHIFPVRTNPNRSCPGRLYSSGGSLGGYGAPVVMQPMLKYLWNGFNLKRINVYKKNERLKTTYPNGHVQYTKWHHTGEYHKTSEVQACFNWPEWKRDNNLGNSYIAMRNNR